MPAEKSGSLGQDSKIAFVTGCTAGIGKAVAESLVGQGWFVFGAGRREERLRSLEAELSPQNFKGIVLDVQDRSAVEALLESHPEVGKVSVLVNNAGLAKGVDAMQSASLDDWEAMVDTNIKGLLYITRTLLPSIQKNEGGHIVNLGSVAGRWTYPGGGVYCSTKHAVRALTEGLRMDLHGSGVRVTNIAPGLVETEFSQVRLEDDEKAKAVYQGMQALTAEDIAECILWSLNRPAHVNIQEMVVFPTAQASVRDVARDL